MECNVIRDLLPLYVDACCSEESARIVKEHLEHCPACRGLFESMNTPCNTAPAAVAPKKLRKIDDWRASVLQSVLLFASFAVITVGVALEATTPSGPENGCWALSLVIPATGFLLSLANWYFVRLYKSKKRFSNCSFLATLGITICAYVWAGAHYALNFAGMMQRLTSFFGIGIGLTVVFCALSKLLSGKYAAMLGKE